MTEQIKKDVEKVKNKLKTEGVNPQDFNKCIEVLKKCVAPVYCCNLYKDYIFNYNN